MELTDEEGEEQNFLEYANFMKYLINRLCLNKADNSAKQHVAQVSKVFETVEGKEFRSKLKPNVRKLDTEGFLHRMLNTHRMPGTIKSNLASLKLFVRYAQGTEIIDLEAGSLNIQKISEWYASMREVSANRKQELKWKNSDDLKKIQ